ncbi:hypothetical protein F4679DRAFT_531399 [Xylaria curta]|nr:hypothetical protein F4679DRAFT_531399 [Xylaria curta]
MNLAYKDWYERAARDAAREQRAKFSEMNKTTDRAILLSPNCILSRIYWLYVCICLPSKYGTLGGFGVVVKELLNLCQLLYIRQLWEYDPDVSVVYAIGAKGIFHCVIPGIWNCKDVAQNCMIGLLPVQQ